MGRLQKIEEALVSINSAAFQELCDSFLVMRNQNYRAFSRTGSQVGKQKTRKGTPDSFFLLTNGNFLYIEITTDTSTKDKLANDIKACFDTKKTKIPIDKIEEIILCFNWDIDQNEMLKLSMLVKEYNQNTVINYLTLQGLALELHVHYPNLVRDYLGLPFDTGQIVSTDMFISEYNKAANGIATPLDNTFLHREQELNHLKNAICQSDIVILTGSAGIGKTKLALEGINNFLTNNLTYHTYCISYKHCDLFEDLSQYIKPNQDNIIHIDDANRIEHFLQIIGFYKSIRKGKLKLILTVRDYAVREIETLCHEYSPIRLELIKFSDEQITDIIKAPPFEILNQDYHKEIIRIADGNPRLAIMAALLAKEHQNIYALRDVSLLFENYFSTFIKDDGEFANPLNIKCLGLIAFFNTIPYTDREISTSILNNFGIDYSAFIDVIMKLEKLELVECQYEHVKISEQNLSTYFFYKAFIKDDLLSFEILLNKYFELNSNRFSDCVIPANNTFGAKNVMDKLQPYLKSHWEAIKSDEEKAFHFFSIFWFYLQSESLEFVYNILEPMPIVAITKYDVTYEDKDSAFRQNKVIELLGNHLRLSDSLQDAIELGFEYTKKKPELLPVWIHKIKEQLTFDMDDERYYRFARQTILFKILLGGFKKNDSLITASFYALSKTFLSFKFHHSRSEKKNTFSWYNYTIPNIPDIRNFRKNIWNAIALNYEKYPELSFNVLLHYLSLKHDAVKEMIEFDIPFLLGIIEKYLNSDSFEHCKYVQEQMRWYKNSSIIHPTFDSLTRRFTNPTYEIFLKIDWDRYRDKEMLEYDNHEEYLKLKEAEIRNSFVFNNANEAKTFYATFVFLHRITKISWYNSQTLDLVIDENSSMNFELGCLLLIEIIDNNNEVNYVPYTLFINHLKTATNALRIWEIIQTKEFHYKGRWELSFFDYLDDTLLTKDYTQLLLNAIRNIKEEIHISFERLQRFLKYEPELFQSILRIIIEKNEKDETRLTGCMDYFSTYFEHFGEDIEFIKQAYLSLDIIDNYFDHDGKGLLKILIKDITFLLDYVNSLWLHTQNRQSIDNKNLTFVWQLNNIEFILKKVFDFVIANEPSYGIVDHFCNSFFRDLNGEIKERAKIFLIDYCKANFSDSHKMNVVVDIIRHSMSDIFDEILLLFLSLTQDREIFSRIWWRGNGTSGFGDDIKADIEIVDWRNILSIVEQSAVGIKLIPIKQYLREQIDSCQKYGDWERKRRFLES